MVTVSGYCDKCRRRNPIAFSVEPNEAWRLVVLNRWGNVCPSCFDAEAEKGPRAIQVRHRGRHLVVGSAGAAEWGKRRR